LKKEEGRKTYFLLCLRIDDVSLLSERIRTTQDQDLIRPAQFDAIIISLKSFFT
jgi:hypothetical protein